MPRERLCTSFLSFWAGDAVGWCLGVARGVFIAGGLTRRTRAGSAGPSLLTWLPMLENKQGAAVRRGTEPQVGLLALSSVSAPVLTRWTGNSLRNQNLISRRECIR